MASRSESGASSPRAGLVTCPTCEYSVPQAPGKKRTICPNCGNFYSKEAAEIATSFQRSSRSRASNKQNNEQPQHSSQQRKPPESSGGNENRSRSGGRLGTISSFFQNLTPNSRRSSREARSESTSPFETSNAGAKDSLPPIDSNSRSHLTSRNGTPSYYSSNNSNSKTGATDGAGGQGSPCGENCIHHKKSSNSRRGQREEDNSHSHHHHHHHCGSHHPQKNSLSPRVLNSGPSRSSSTPSKSSGDINGDNHDEVVGPVRTKTVEQLKADFVTAKETGNWRILLDFYSMTFDSFVELNAAFKRDPTKDYRTTEDPGLKFDFISLVYDILIKTPQGLQKEVLKAVINSLLKDKRPHSKDDLRAFLILVQNPQFSNQTAYVIFAHLLRQIAALSDHDHHYLVHWLKRLKQDRFRPVVERIHNFISVRLFPSKPEDLPPLSKCSWWIPSATKVLALFNAANNLMLPPIVTYTEFYNSTLDHLDLMAEYYAWQNPSSHAGFSFCQYPFILSIAAKRTVLQKDSEQQMIIMARKSLVAKVQRRQLPDIGMLFLNLTVRRSHLVSDSLNEIAQKQHDLKKKLKVSFTGEPGLDMGGLTKEWFLLLVRQIFLTDYGMFTYDKHAGVHWFSPNPCDNYQEFNLVGVLMGLAVYNSINLDIRFPPVCYRKLLSPAVVPFNNPRATVGISPVTMHDLKAIQPGVAKGLQELLDYDGDVEDVFCLNFEVVTSNVGTTKTSPLKPNGENIPVTNENKKEYVQLYIEWVLNNSIYAQFQAFYHGFHSVCASNALIMLRPEEVETLVCGSPTLVMEDLKKVTVYDGYTAQNPTIRYFWDVVLNLPLETQKRLLLFATGSDRIPIGGISEMTFKISRIDDLKLLPMSHTCFNQLVLPPYKNKKVLKQKLITAISNAEGFGLE
ncbi:probable E3 ubiquitin-protein ligase HECTD2 isoform X2 [Aplysia californica]|uniref:HECT-type E3 ubiquitin transferase n=1 Tax=Aplysia californica TaxID=6500 RepID=A0ABM1VU31_APLCA|nr:probable E3 ubiquitin-protein ligase HECTD2 isoform X2 [Aplysia californica]